MNAGEHDAPVDPGTVDWSRAVEVRYRIEQTLRYEYAAPIRDLHHQLMIAPRRRHLDQTRVAHRLWTTAGVPLNETLDAFGNEVAVLHVACVESAIGFGLESTLVRARARRDAAADPGDPAWRDVGRLTRADTALLDIAADLRALHPQPHERAEAVANFVHRHMIYTKHVTDVFTTASTAFAMGRGVCQDYAHLAIAIARASGIGARYASGHFIGEGATHAWVEFLIPAGTAACVLSLDPTYGTPTDFRYVVVAIGRDYGDVAPTSGVFSGSSCGRLLGKQHLHLTGVTYAA